MYDGALTAYNKITNYHVRVEWSIGGLKCKFQLLVNQFDATKVTKLKYNYLFGVMVILTNFMHWYRLDFYHKNIGDHLELVSDHHWDGDY